MPPFEPALEEDLSDTNLARLLAADARSASQKYSSQGLSAFLGGRSSATPKAKPNTLFLKNLVKNADTHNDRLKRKEDAERREKLRKLDEQDEERRRDERVERRENRNEEEGRERKRRKLEGDDDNDRRHSSRRRRGRDRERRHRRRLRRNTSSESSRSQSPSKSRSRDRVRGRHQDSHRKHRSRRENYDSGSDKADAKHRSHRKHTRRRTGTPSPLAKEDERDKKDRTSKSPVAQEVELPSTNPLNNPPNPHPTSSQPPSKIDAHFSPTYDPTTDVHPTSDSDSDWHRALNAMRDRANFQHMQASRLLAAGFSEEQVKKWETQPSHPDNSESRDVRHVKWKAKGEEREWDRGKPMLGEDVDFSDAEDDADSDKSISGRRRDKKAGAEAGWTKSGGLLKGFKSALGS